MTDNQARRSYLRDSITGGKQHFDSVFEKHAKILVAVKPLPREHARDFMAKLARSCREVLKDRDTPLRAFKLYDSCTWKLATFPDQDWQLRRELDIAVQRHPDATVIKVLASAGKYIVEAA